MTACLALLPVLMAACLSQWLPALVLMAAAAAVVVCLLSLLACLKGLNTFGLFVQSSFFSLLHFL